MGRKLGTSGRVVRRKELKPRKPQTDENLLAAAMRDAEKWQEQLRRTRNT